MLRCSYDSWQGYTQRAIISINLMFASQDELEELCFHTPIGMPDELLPLLTPKPPLETDPSPNLDILLSKYLNNDELNDIELQQLNQQERMVLQSVKGRSKKGKKRPDEYQKLFFKRAFKYAEREFFGKSKNKSRKMSAFYHHHFELIAQSMGIPLVNFYHPDKKTKPGLRTGQKSFNLAYIKLLLRSDSFREVSRSYYCNFKADCLAERASKIPKFVTYVKGVILRHGHDPQRMAEMIQSSKCKIPWSNSEIEEADRRAMIELENGKVLQSQKGGDEEEVMDEQLDYCSEIDSEE